MAEEIILVEEQFGGDPIDLEWLDSSGTPRDFTDFDTLKVFINDEELDTLVKGPFTVTDEGSGILRWTIVDGDVPAAGTYIMIWEAIDAGVSELPARQIKLTVLKKGTLV